MAAPRHTTRQRRHHRKPQTAAERDSRAKLERRLRRYKKLLDDASNAFYYVAEAAEYDLRAGKTRRRGSRGGVNAARRRQDAGDDDCDYGQRGAYSMDKQRVGDQDDQDTNVDKSAAGLL